MNRVLLLDFLKRQLATVTILMVLLLALMSYVNGFSYFCDSLATLTRRSNVVVLGLVERISGFFLHKGQVYGSPTSDFITNVTIFELRVLSYAKGTGPRSVYLVDDGDLLFRSQLKIDEPTIVSVGENYVLFLSNDWNCAPSPPYSPCSLPPTPLSDTYRVMGGLQGKFHVVDNRVYRVEICKKTDLAAMNGMPTDEFLARAYVSAHNSFIIATVLAAFSAVGGGAVLFVRKRWSLRSHKPSRAENILSAQIPPAPPKRKRSLGGSFTTP